MSRRALLPLAFLAGVLSTYYYFQKFDRTPTRQSVGLHQPTRVPDRVILNWNGDPTTTQAVTWRTSVDVDQAVAEIAVAEDGPLFVDNARRVAAATEPFESDLGPAHYHSVAFNGLEPETLYVYRVGDGEEAWSEWLHFRTASTAAKPLTFLYVGDAQNDIFSMWSRLIRQGYAAAPDADFLIHAGDLINRANRDAEWGEWSLAAGWINRSVPSLPTPGNHEYDKTDGQGLSRHWRPSFTLPENGPAGPPPETSYFIDVQGVRIVALNSNEAQQEQAAWLDGLLADNPNRWTVVTHHHPIFSASEGRDNPELRALWQPIYDKHGVDLVLQGHDHTYARSNLMTGENVQNGPAGTVYVVSVSGPKMYEVQDAPWMVRSAEDTQLFQKIRIDGDLLRFESYTARGILYDAFELRKRDGQPNELVEIEPESPVRRRPKE
ncbi:MAG: metallophosphoesterase [Acidobacteria bacterium]|nr:metallophosphoesterase [Acidobacteriota bacterium]